MFTVENKHEICIYEVITLKHTHTFYGCTDIIHQNFMSAIKPLLGYMSNEQRVYATL